MTDAIRKARDDLKAALYARENNTTTMVGQLNKFASASRSALAAIDAALEGGAVPKVKALDDDTDFKLGDIVETVKGAAFWGEIIAFDNDGKSAGCTVLAIAPGFEGTKHVYPLKQLRRLPSPPTGA